MSVDIHRFAEVLETVSISDESRILLTDFVKKGESFVVIPDEGEHSKKLAQMMGGTAALIPLIDWMVLYPESRSRLRTLPAGGGRSEMLIVHGTEEPEATQVPLSVRFKERNGTGYIN